MTTDRRQFMAMTVCASLAFIAPVFSGTPTLPSCSPIMAARIRAMCDAMAALKTVADPLEGDLLRHARDCVENAFMTPTICAADEDALMVALDAYEEIHPSAFAMQTARDLFTPRRYQTYSRERLRHWLLTDPEEEFAKSGMPGFLREMRERHRALAISA
jgi:hypothetical protein